MPSAATPARPTRKQGSSMTRRFRDPGRQIYHFDDLFLVRCPQCAHCATVTRVQMAHDSTPPLARIVCLACGYSKDSQEAGFCGEGPVDGYFGLPLWLQIPCCGHTLWAFNTRHLELVEQFVAASLREKSGMAWAHLGYTLVDRLPEWIQRGNNRAAILHCIAKLRETLV